MKARIISRCRHYPLTQPSILWTARRGKSSSPHKPGWTSWNRSWCGWASGLP